MTSSASVGLIPVTTMGACSAATLCFRLAGKLHLTVVLKATFALVPGAPMRPLGPEPIFEHDHALGADLSPYLPSVDVVLTGHAWAPRTSARLALFRGDPLFDKTVEVVGPVGAPVTAFAPLPGTGRRLAELFVDAIPELPADLPWTDLQSAPEDQRVAALAGDEWVVLEGLHAEHRRLASRLPTARARATLFGLSPDAPDAARSIALRPDVLRVDADALRCSLGFRAVVPLDDERSLETLRIAGGVGTELAPLGSPSPPPLPARRPARKPEPAPFDGTMDLTERPVIITLPFGKAALPSPAKNGSEKGPSRDAFEGTLDLSGAAPAAQPTLPFAPGTPSEAPATAARPIEGAPWSSAAVALPPRPRAASLELTLALGGDDLLQEEPPAPPPPPPLLVTPSAPPQAPPSAPPAPPAAPSFPPSPPAPTWSWAEQPPAPKVEAPRPPPPRPPKPAVNKTLYGFGSGKKG